MKIYNSLSRRKEEFIPLHPGEARVYVCGPTVYNYFHVGNARPFIIFDTLRRYLAYRGYQVTFVQNFTDIDDKMINRAREDGVTVRELGDRFIGEYFIDAKALGIMPADVHPRATEHIGEIIGMIQKLIDSGHAYESEGDVYFSVPSMTDYGKLSGQKQEDLLSGARVEVDARKRNGADFDLWKAQKPGEPAWDSPWGKGRPGWHIECSAMSTSILGDTIDIHGGGEDLAFPHHENEIAQSECATGKPFARYFMHNGFINIDNQKMSKSLGNFFTVREIAKEFDLEAVRMFMLGAHYRSPVNFSRDQIAQSAAALSRLYTARAHFRHIAAQGGEGPVSKEMRCLAERAKERFIEAMDDDLNTADALGVLFELVRQANAELDASPVRASGRRALDLIDELTGVLGLLYHQSGGIPPEVQSLADARAMARKEKNWAESDRLRDEIRANGFIVEDTKQGQKLRPAED